MGNRTLLLFVRTLSPRGRTPVIGVLCNRLAIAIDACDSWPRGPMDKASAHGAGDCRLKSCRGQCRKMLHLSVIGSVARAQLGKITRDSEKKNAAGRQHQHHRNRKSAQQHIGEKRIGISAYQYISTSAHQHISISSYQHISISAYHHISISADRHISISTYQQISISVYQHISIPVYQDISISAY